MKKFLRFIGILLMGLTAAATLLGGAGTTCVALNPAAYDSMRAIADYQWLYILYVLFGLALGVMGIMATIRLIKASPKAERFALITLDLGVGIGVIHILTSRALRGSSMPVDGVVYITALTLLVFLLFKLPKVREMGLFEGDTEAGASAAGGLTAIVAAALVLSVQMWAEPDHLIQGINYAGAFQPTLQLVGGGLFLLGIILIAKALLFQRDPQPAQQAA